jgi:NTP pyrophosphatase (non-canonical NTP hydrolase)
MMCADGLAKLIEECGELIQVCGKKLAYFDTNEHPDGGPPLNQRLEEEMADVVAAINTAAQLLGLDEEAITSRVASKQALFRKWHGRADNNEHGVQVPRRPR